MSENRDYWKELLGDDYNEELFKELIDPNTSNGSEKQEKNSKRNRFTEENKKPMDKEDDGFQTVNFGTSNAIPMESGAYSNDTGFKDFDVDFDFDREYRDVPDNRPIKRKRVKKTGCLSGIMFAAFVICVSLLLASLGWMAATDVLGLSDDSSAVEVTIPEDFDMNTVAQILRDNGLIKYKSLFKLYSGFSSADEKIDAGTYELQMDYDYRALVNGMTASGGIKVEVDVTIPEGYTMSQIFKLLDTNGICTVDVLWETAATYEFEYDFLDSATLGEEKRLEGYLFPDTYTFYVGDSPNRVINKMLGNFNNKLTEEYITRAEELGYTIGEIITIASMIEKEAAGDSERATIASVIYNRLDSSSFPYLQIDATIIYAIADTDEEFSTSVDSPYNTYQHEGLPIGPIANPGIASIKAALYPESTSYYFYALSVEKHHEFFKNSDAFTNFVNSDQYGG